MMGSTWKSKNGSASFEQLKAFFDEDVHLIVPNVE